MVPLLDASGGGVQRSLIADQGTYPTKERAMRQVVVTGGHSGAPAPRSRSPFHAGGGDVGALGAGVGGWLLHAGDLVPSGPRVAQPSRRLLLLGLIGFAACSATPRSPTGARSSCGRSVARPPGSPRGERTRSGRPRAAATAPPPGRDRPSRWRARSGDRPLAGSPRTPTPGDRCCPQLPPCRLPCGVVADRHHSQQGGHVAGP